MNPRNDIFHYIYTTILVYFEFILIRLYIPSLIIYYKYCVSSSSCDITPLNYNSSSHIIMNVINKTMNMITTWTRENDLPEHSDKVITVLAILIITIIFFKLFDNNPKSEEAKKVAKRVEPNDVSNSLLVEEVKEKEKVEEVKEKVEEVKEKVEEVEETSPAFKRSQQTPAKNSSLTPGFKKGTNNRSALRIRSSGALSTPRNKKRWHTHAYIEETTIVFDSKEDRFGVKLKGPEIAGKGHEILGCHVFSVEQRQPKCEGLKIDMTLVEIDGVDVTNESIDVVRSKLQNRPLTTRWILFEMHQSCPDTPEIYV
jgi:hypothetical protein